MEFVYSAYSKAKLPEEFSRASTFHSKIQSLAMKKKIQYYVVGIWGYVYVVKRK